MRRAAAEAEGKPKKAFHVGTADLRAKRLKHKTGSLVVFVLDNSGSMRSFMEPCKAAVKSLLVDAYKSRDLVSLITLDDDIAKVTLEPTRSVSQADQVLRDVEASGKFPLTFQFEDANTNPSLVVQVVLHWLMPSM